MCAHTHRAVDQMLETVLTNEAAIESNIVRMGSSYKIRKEFQGFEFNSIRIKRKTGLDGILKDLRKLIRNKQNDLSNFSIDMNGNQASQQQQSTVDVITDEFIDMIISGNIKYHDFSCDKLSYLKDQIEKRRDKAILETMDIIFTTLYAIEKLQEYGLKVDKLIIDEATQIVEPEVILGINMLSETSHVVFVGDLQQLCPVVKSTKAIYNGLSISLYERLLGKITLDLLVTKRIHARNFKSNNNPDNFCLLNKQYRMPKILMKPSNMLFYNNKISSFKMKFKPIKGLPSLLKFRFPFIFISLNYSEQQKVGTSYTNPKEAEFIRKLIVNMVDNHEINPKDIGIIAMHTKQERLLQSLLWNYNDIECGSVDSFQGKEKDIIILSLTRTRNFDSGFLCSPSRINVSITRQKKSLIVIGNYGCIMNSGNIIWKKILDIYCNKKYGYNAIKIVKNEIHGDRLFNHQSGIKRGYHEMEGQSSGDIIKHDIKRSRLE